MAGNIDRASSTEVFPELLVPTNKLTFASGSMVSWRKPLKFSIWSEVSISPVSMTARRPKATVKSSAKALTGHKATTHLCSADYFRERGERE